MIIPPEQYGVLHRSWTNYTRPPPEPEGWVSMYYTTYLSNKFPIAKAMVMVTKNAYQSSSRVNKSVGDP